jgi:4-hydroxybenzoate polyprenyltransferase
MNLAVTPPEVAAVQVTPLCVDLDGTLIRGDTLVESAVALLARAPWLLFAMFWWLLGGKAHLKAKIAARHQIEAHLLPYREHFVEWLREEQRQRPVYLATAAHRSIGEAVARHLGLFAGVFATDAVNLSSSAKAAALTEAFGAGGFDYAGNDGKDLAVWEQSRGIVVVGATRGIARAASAMGRVTAQFDPAPSALSRVLLWFKALRVYQWVKNVLIFLAPLAAHTLFEPDTLHRSLLAFVAFGLVASAIYVLNDLTDLSADRAHPRKRNRAFASGKLPLMHGLFVVPVLLLAGFALASLLGWAFCVVLLSYVVVTTLYSVWLKRKLFIDVAALAWLYSVRVVAGAVACSLPLSSWLLAFCLYIFLCLALVKRFAELVSLRNQQREDSAGRAYRVQDMPVVMALGCGSGLLASLVMTLYVDSQASRMHYSQPEFLWVLGPLVVVAVGRLWIAAGRGAMHDDPIVFVATDRVCLVLLALTAAIVFLAI